MYTGIVTHRGRLVRIDDRDEGCRRLVIRPEPAIEDVALGGSIAVDGVCLTVSNLEPEELSFDVMPETLRCTTLGDRTTGDVVNLERSLRLGDELGGHWVQGHVEGTGIISAVEKQGEDVRMAIRVPDPLHGALLPKGSISVDGISLTVGEVWNEGDDDAEEHFSVYLIPHTLAITGLGTASPGDRVNLEPDVMGRWVQHHMERMLDARRPQ